MGRISIETILGGHSPLTHFASKDHFRASLGIDPAQPIDDADTQYSTIASGLLRPAASQKYSGAVLQASPLWMVPNPKDANVYVYDARGSAYTVDATFNTVTALVDGGSLTSALGNGCEYYDNYIYFFKNLDVARYGPLNGAATFNGSYWVGTLGKTALTNTAYPTTFKNNIQLPNHIGHRHRADGKLYFADVVGNQGYIHYIATTKVSVEGDTNNNSTYGAITLGYGEWPTEIETYGTDLAVAIYEGSLGGLRQPRAKLAFWDTTSSSINKIISVEYPDQIITAMKNINGILYVVSGNFNSRGFRVTRFIGGYSFEEVFYSEVGEPCLPGAIDGTLNRVLFGSHTTVPESDGCVHSLGLQKTNLGKGLFNVMRATGGNSSTSVTAVCLADNSEFGFYTPTIGWSQAGEGSTGAGYGLDKQGTQYNNAPSVFWSQMFRIGRPFGIDTIRINLAQAIAANMIVTPTIYTDDGQQIVALTTINNSNYPGLTNIVIRPNDLNGKHNFWLELKWTGSVLCVVNLPIEIEYSVVEDPDNSK